MTDTSQQPVGNGPSHDASHFSIPGGGRKHSRPDYEAMRSVVTIHEADEKPKEHRMLMADEAHGVFACVKGGVVVNTIVIDTADSEAINLFKSQYDDLVLIQNPGVGSPGTGWLQPGGPGTALQAPIVPSLAANPTTIPPDGVTASTVTYTDRTATAPASVVFNVNGTDSAPQSLVNGEATLTVTSQTPGDTITVKVGDLTTTIQVSAT